MNRIENGIEFCAKIPEFVQCTPRLKPIGARRFCSEPTPFVLAATVSEHLCEQMYVFLAGRKQTN